MVAYKRLSNDERDKIQRQMVTRYRQTTNLTNTLMPLINARVTLLLTKDTPKEVTDFAEKYPNLVLWHDLDLDLRRADQIINHRENTDWSRKFPKIHVRKYFAGFSDLEKDVKYVCYSSDGKFNHWHFDSDETMNWIRVKDPETWKLIEQAVKENNEILDWENTLACTLDHISTLNKLKSEFPEAYEIYVQFYGTQESKTPCQKKGNSAQFCDAIEKVRATYSKVSEKNTSTNKL